MFITETVLKKNLYSRIKTILSNNGWKNISSIATDYDVFTNDNKDLYFQLRDINGFSTGTAGYITFRLIRKYTPGTTGVAGTFFNSADVWQSCYLIPSTTVDCNTPLSITWSCDNSRFILNVDTPYPLGLNSEILYIGIPNKATNENNIDGLVIAGSAISSGATNLLYVTNNTYVPKSTFYTLTASSILPSLSKNIANKVFMSEIAYGSTTEGMRGTLQDIYAITNNKVARDTILINNGKKYKVIIVAPVTVSTSVWYNSLTSNALAISIE